MKCLKWLLLLIIVSIAVNCSAEKRGMGTYTTYPITYSDGTVSSIAIYTPTGYVEGSPVKWMVHVHGLGASAVARINEPEYTSMADTYKMILVGINSELLKPWFDTDLYPRLHIEEGIALAKTKHDLTAFLPCLYGVSMGGRKVIHEMVYHPEKYSCFAYSAGVTDMIVWDADNTIWDPSWETFMGGPTTSSDPTIHARWIQDAPRSLLPTANLRERKLYIVHGTADAAVPYTTHFTAITGLIPTNNLDSAITVTGGIHQDFMLDTNYNDGFFQFMSNNSIPAFIRDTTGYPVISRKTDGNIAQIYRVSDL